jgi:hypothetical protein
MESSDKREFVVSRIFISCDQDRALEPLQRIEWPPENGFAPVAAAFSRNIQAVISTATVPFRLAVAGVQRLRWQQLLTAERIRARNLLDQGATEADAEQAALRKANGRMAAELRTDSGRIGERVLDSLHEALGGYQFADGAAELLRQCTVLIWSGFEVLASDTFVHS